MELTITLKDNECGLELTKKSGGVDPVVEIPKAAKPQGSKSRNFHSGVDSEIFSYYHDLDEKLITHIDKLVKRNKIDIRIVKSYKIQGNLGENATSVKIAEAVIEALKS